MPKRNHKVLRLCGKADILYEERKSDDLRLRLLRCAALCVSVNCPQELTYVLDVWSPAAVLFRGVGNFGDWGWFAGRTLRLPL